jgi:hypothetical protein|tara:strand:- start:1194 stop:1400 length:207 start_codon:yes stop_codon:yes gene_type:complete
MKKILIINFFILVITNNAYAYIDPGSGSIILQAILGAIAAIGATISIYWLKIKKFFSKIKKNLTDDKQ